MNIPIKTVCCNHLKMSRDWTLFHSKLDMSLINQYVSFLINILRNKRKRNNSFSSFHFSLKYQQKQPSKHFIRDVFSSLCLFICKLTFTVRLQRIILQFCSIDFFVCFSKCHKTSGVLSSQSEMVMKYIVLPLS